MDIDSTLLEAVDRMEKAVAALDRDFAKLRTGRASTALVDGIKADYYGTPTPVSQMASVAVPDSRTLTISDNGIGIMYEYKNRDAEGTIQDDYRVDFVRQHLEWSPRPLTKGPSAAATTTGPSLTTGPGQMPSRTVMALSRSTSWTAISAVLRNRQLGSSRSPRPTWWISDRALSPKTGAQPLRKRAITLAHLVAEGDRPPCA